MPYDPEARRRQRESRRRALALNPNLVEHGKRSTYCNWGCTCAPCRKANADYPRKSR